ncbi:MAG: hypothetical protein GY696_33650 [Gammaproteobacteria bacterium]|nr:hypothetical protein [Gammaproteobacteria bacterium]
MENKFDLKKHGCTFCLKERKQNMAQQEINQGGQMRPPVVAMPQGDVEFFVVLGQN